MTTCSKSKSNKGSSKKQASALRKPTQDKKGKDKTKAAGWKDTIETRAAQHNMTVKWTDDTITEQQINKENNTSNKENTPTNMESDRDTSTTTNGSNRISLGNPTGETTTEPSDNKMEKLLRENIVYTTLIVAPPKTKASKRIEIYISMLKFIFKIIQSIDEDIILYTYDDTTKENITSDMTLFGGSTTTFPNSLTSLKKFFAGLHVRDTTKLYLNLRIGTNKDAKDVIGSGNALLQDATDPDVPESCNANWYAKHLQVPYTKDCGWIAGLFYNCNGKEFETILQSRLDTCYDKGKLKIRIPISVHTKNVRLAPNTAKKQDNNKKQNDMTTRTFHVEVPKGTKQTASSYIHSILKRSPALSARTNVKFTWVPVIDKDASTADIAYSSAALAHHKSLLSSCEFSYVPGIEDLNVTSNRLGGKSLRDIILSLTLPSDDTRKVFVLAETGYNGEALLYYAKKWASEARGVIKFLLFYLRRTYPNAGAAVEKGFSLEAIEAAEDFVWDEIKKCPTSKEAQELEQQLALSKTVAADLIIENMHILLKDDDDEETARPKKKQRDPAWENTSFKSQGGQRDDATKASESQAASLSDATSNAGDEGPPANQR